MRSTGVLTLTLLAACTSLGACELVAGIGDRTLGTGADSGTPSSGDASSGSDATIPSDDGGQGDAQSSDGGDAAPYTGCLSNSECTDEATQEGPMYDAGPDASFKGTLDGGIVPAVCLRSTGKCARLLTQDCRDVYGDYRNDDSILIGTIFNTTGSLQGANLPRQNAALLAAKDINSNISGGGIPGPDGGVRPLLVLECDPTANTIRTAQHLALDLKVPAVVGPNVAEDGINITQMVSAQAGMLLMTPTIPVDPLTNLNDNGLTWRDVPSDHQRSPVYGDQIQEIASELQSAGRNGNLKLGLVVRNDALGLSALNSISSVPWDGMTVGSPPPNTVSIDEYALTDTTAQANIVAKYASSVPDVVFVVAQEAVANIVIPLEQKLTSNNYTGPRPYYLATDTSKTTGWLSKPAGVPSDFQSRVRGVGVTPDQSSAAVFDAFNSEYSGTYMSNPGTAGMGPAYDAMYSVAYAMAATKDMPVTGANVAKGLNQLVYGSSFPVGLNSASGAFQALATARHIALQGTFTLMHWDGNGDIVGGTLQVWCITAGSPGGDAGPSFAFVDSGRDYDITTSKFTGMYNSGGTGPCATN
jgi:hypothetical protein